MRILNPNDDEMIFYRSTDNLYWRRFWRCLTLILVMVYIVVFPSDVSGQGNQGQITNLTVNDAPGQGITITINTTLFATTNIVKSNLTFVLVAPDGSTVQVSQISVPRNTGPNESWSHSWSISNSTFPSAGTYTVEACWSTGKARNCDIDFAISSFFSVPTLGWISLPLFGMAIYFLWKHNAEKQLFSKEKDHGLE